MKKTVAAALLITSCATGAWAQVYVGAAIGPSHVNLDCQGTAQCDQDDSGFKLFGGLKLDTNLSIEASYMDFGTARYQYTAGGVTTGRLDVTGLTLAGAWRMDFTPEFAGVLRLGVAYVETKVKEQGVSSASASSHATKPYWGLGAEYAFSKHVKGVAAADFTTGKFRGTNGVVHLYTLGAQLDF
jgi:OOP family OmpA-OmpF porin